MESPRPEGWLPPSIQAKLDHTIRWIRSFQEVLPSDASLVIEVGRFDAARMKDPSIHGELYQKGPQYDHENVKAYVFARDGYTCQVCGRKGGKLIAHHIRFRSRGATDNPEEMCTVGDCCHTTANHRPGGVLYAWMLQDKKFRKDYRDTVFMNILAKRLRGAFPGAVYTWGNFTCADRKAMHLEKSHANDAAVISFRGRKLPERIRVPEPLYYQQVRKKKRSLHESVPRKGRKGANRTQKRNEKNTSQVTVRTKKGPHTVCLYDQAEVNGKKGWVTGFTGSSCYVCDKWGKYITASPKYKQVSISEVRILGHNNNWALGPRVMLGKK